MVFKHYCYSLLSLAILASVGWPVAVQAQDPPVLGDEFIFFVNGPNVTIPVNGTTTVNDPMDPENQVAKFGFAGWGEVEWGWPRASGVDMSANIAETAGAGDMLFFKIMVSSENLGDPTKLTFFDKDEGSSLDRAGAEALGPDAIPDYRTRMNWPIPEWMKNDEWHSVAIFLPPASIAALDSAKVDKNADGTPLDVPLDSLSKLWSYGGAWAGFGVACCGSAFDGAPSEDPLFKEFEFGNVSSFAIHYDYAEGGGDVWIDDFYIGDESTDLSSAENPPKAMTNGTFGTDGTTNVVSWTGDPEFGGYNVYVSESPITDVDSEDVVALTSVAFDADYVVNHMYAAPHPTMAADATLHYAITSTSFFGVENKTPFPGEITNDLDSQPFIVMLTEDEADAIFTNIENGVVTGDGFPAGLAPFVIEECEVAYDGFGPCPSGQHVSYSDGIAPDESPGDISAKLWIGMSSDSDLLFYAEVTDDIIGPSLTTETGGDAWNHDSIEITIGTLELESALIGSTGDHIDSDDQYHQLRFAFHGDSSDVAQFTSTWESNAIVTDVPGGLTVFDILDDSNGKVTGIAGAPIGWKMLAVVPLSQILWPTEVTFVPPADDGIKLIPFSIGINDDDSGGRNHQVNWSTKLNVSNNWWNQPKQWPSVAVAGSAVSTASEDDILEQPGTFALEQNYPNPFNPSTSIRFAIPSADRVTLAVYDVLGQRVATLIGGKTMSAGVHSVSFDASHLASGMYTYRLEAGSEFVQTRRMLLVK